MKRAFSAFLIVIVLGVMCHPVTAEASGETDIIALMNEARAEQGLGEVVADAALESAALTRAKECAVKFSHTRPDGNAWYTVSEQTRGENLAHAVNSNQSKPENVVLAWLLSPAHKANVLRQTFTSVGIASYIGENGETYIVCEFR